MARRKNSKIEIISDKEWLALPLTYLGDSCSSLILENELKKIFKSPLVQYFIPRFTEKDQRHEKEIILFNGYIFLKGMTPKELSRIGSGNSYFQSPLRMNEKLAGIQDKEIKTLKKKLDALRQHNLAIGSTVLIEEGIYKNLTGEVIELDDKDDSASILVILSSKEVLARVSQRFLTKQEL